MGKVIQLADFRNKTRQGTPTSQTPTGPKEHVTFIDFVQAVQMSELSKASQCLTMLLNIPFEKAENASYHFHQLFCAGEPVVDKARNIRTLLIEGQTNESLIVLYECFKLSGVDAICALESMRGMIPAKTT